MPTIVRIMASTSSTRPRRLKILSRIALGKTARVAAVTLKPRCRLGRSDIRLARTSTAVSGLTFIFLETSFISQKFASEKKVAHAQASATLQPLTSPRRAGDDWVLISHGMSQWGMAGGSLAERWDGHQRPSLDEHRGPGGVRSAAATRTRPRTGATSRECLSACGCRAQGT
jgi:hypothetical protein